MRVEFFEPHHNLPPAILDTFPNELHYAAGEDVIAADNFASGKKPSLRYPQLFRYAKSLHIEPNHELREAVKKTPYTVFVGPSGSGRNTLIKHLAKAHPDEYVESLSVTTRGFRFSDGVLEVQGGNYFHWTHEEVLEAILKGEFLECEIIHWQQVSGLHIKSFNSIPEGLTGLNDTELEGAEQLFRLDGRPSVFFVPKDFNTWIHKRIEGCSAQERASRLRSSIREFRSALDSPYFAYFINDISAAQEGTPGYEQSLANNGADLHGILTAMRDHGMSGYVDAYRDYSDTARLILQSHIKSIIDLLGQ